MTSELSNYVKTGRDGQVLDWVRVRVNKKVRLNRRYWTDKSNLTLNKGDETLVPRNGQGMKFFFRNDEWFTVLNNDPDVPFDEDADVEEVEEVFECSDCGREFGSERGLNSHRSQKHKDEDNKNEESEE